MKPPASSEKSPATPTAPPSVRQPLLRLTAKGATTAEVAEKLGLPELTVWRYLDRLRVAGDVTLRSRENGREAEWLKTSKPRRST